MHVSRLSARLNPPWLRHLLRLLLWAALGLYFAVALLVLAVRHAVLPSIEDYRDDIERALAGALARPVAIRAIDARWRGLWPQLAIRGLEIRDAEGRPALGFDLVEADIAWSSLWHFQPRFARLEIVAPSLEVRRERDGRLFVAGLEIDTGHQEGDFSGWLLAQDRLVIRDATISWHDELRGAPPLALSRLNLELRNSGNRHRFGLTAQPPRQLAARLDIRGDFHGESLDQWQSWQGEAYAELDYADLAGWQAWADYPLELPRGSGGLRLWLGFEQRQLSRFTADLRLAEAAVRLGDDLPMLELDRLEGRLTGRRLADGYAASAHQLALTTRDGIRIEPTDFDFQWHGPANASARGEASANGLDLGALAALAGHLPFDGALRGRLAAFGPQGRIMDLKLSWLGGAEALSAFSVKGRFEDLGLRAQGVLPGFSGLDGRIEGNEKGGVLELASRDAGVELPAVFAEATTAFSVLEARAQWRSEGDGVEVQIEHARFENADAAGVASGRYRSRPDGPGEIDLSAKLTRAAGNAVWRYMPLVVNSETRDWLKRSIIGGAATASLRLKGDLARFPFKDGSGVFEVKGPFHGASLDYAAGWPRFEQVVGDLEFVGARMTIRAQKARLWGVNLTEVKAEIPDLEASEELMIITGIARGPTTDFLRFIEASPVGERIDHFTEDMKATGSGELRLRLDMPLRHVVDTRVDGRYRFLGNGLVVDADLPPLAEVNGELHFTGDRLEAKRLRANLLGAPMVVDVATQDGRVAVKATGTMSVLGLRQQFGSPVFEHLSGAAPWTGTIQVKKRDAEVRIESSLQGISSSLPEPFNKSANEVLPLIFERKPPPEPARGKRGDKPLRDQLVVSLGDALRLQLLRREEAGQVVLDRGAVAVGTALPRLPERGVALAVQARRLDTDFWRRLANGNGGGAPLPVNQFDLRAEQLVALGHSLNGLRLAGSLDGGHWKMDLKSREAQGTIDWSGEGAGRLTARLAYLAVPEGGEHTAPSGNGQATEQLPALDLTVDRLLLKGQELGGARLRAENVGGAWNANFQAHNDDGSLEGNGRWRPDPVSAETRFDFRLEAKSIERFLGRVGYPDAVRRGTAKLEGNIAWAGPPTRVDYGSLNGQIKLEAQGGQFKKLEPGVGRLLGILSLQSLPRRITLDFRDIFSEGFAFDSIGGQFSVRRGVLETRDLQIQGPAARILMSGSVNLPQETQNLRVRVQPAIGETLATGMLLVNPATGAVAWLADKLLKDPLGQIFAYEYAVTGSWADPKVEKVAAAPSAQTPPPGATP